MLKFVLANAMKRRITSVLAIGLLTLNFFSFTPVFQVEKRPGAVFLQPDSVLFQEKQKIAEQESGLNAKTLAVARSFLGTPYATGILDSPGEEKLVVNLRRLDCWTLVECSLAIAQTGSGSFDDYKSHLQQLRYWGGTVKGYGSRIHYFTGWLLQAEQLGVVRDITKDLGGVLYLKKVGYITARPAKYPKIRNSGVWKALLGAEKRINSHKWHYIHQSKIAAIENQLMDGDIILLTSAKRDLDISHQGFAVRQNGRIHLLHASSLSKKVIISKQPLPEYVLSQKGQTGIMVARVREQED